MGGQEVGNMGKYACNTILQSGSHLAQTSQFNLFSGHGGAVEIVCSGN